MWQLVVKLFLSIKLSIRMVSNSTNRKTNERIRFNNWTWYVTSSSILQKLRNKIRKRKRVEVGVKETVEERETDVRWDVFPRVGYPHPLLFFFFLLWREGVVERDFVRSDVFSWVGSSFFFLFFLFLRRERVVKRDFFILFLWNSKLFIIPLFSFLGTHFENLSKF